MVELALIGFIIAIQLIIFEYRELSCARCKKNCSLQARQLLDLEKQIGRSLKGWDEFRNRLSGVEVRARIAEKMAERAFAMASAGTVGLGILQKTLQTKPRLMTKEQLEKNEVAKKKLNEMFGTEEIEFLKPILTDEEIEIYEKAVEHTMKYGGEK